MSFDLGSKVQVPVNTLMCSDVRMSSLLRETRPVHRRELPLVLSLLDDVIDRWYDAIGSMNPAIYETYRANTDTVRHLQECFAEVAEDDSPSVFDTRARLGDLIEDFDSLMETLAAAFMGPRELREFYYNISSRMRLTAECIMEGTHGW
jgi:hypothetical protein